MADQDSRDAEKSLVLSIFRGENFVIKGVGSCRALVRAKCADLKPELALETGTVKLFPGNSEPEFNSQLAWSLSRKQLKELRSNRSTIRVSCILVDDRTGSESEVGYVVLHVKDATAFDIGDVDPAKARTHTLLGTKDSWRSLQPKLQMILQLEDLVTREKRNRQDEKPTSHKVQLPAEPSKIEHDIPSEKIPIINAAKLAETKQLQKETTEKFLFTINENDGYFQLGFPGDKDDLYILNSTVISASYLHLLWDGRSPRKRTADNDFWQIKYSVYGCEIASDPFLLADDDESRRTFIGDKATARIRTSGGLFFQYLEQTTIEFQILRYQIASKGELTNGEVMGLCYASLADLTNPNNSEHKVSLEVVSEWGTPRVISAHERPEIRVTFNLDAVPGFYSMYTTSQIQINTHEPHSVGATSEQKGKDVTDFNDNDQRKRDKLFIQGPSSSPADKLDQIGQTSSKKGNSDNHNGAEIVVQEETSNRTNAGRLLEFENENHNKKQNDSDSSSSFTTSPEHRNHLRPKKHKNHGFLSDSEDSEFTGNENLSKILPALGKYSVTIELTRFWLKSKRLITSQFLLSYTHTPLGISDEPVECLGTSLSPDFTDSRQGFHISDGVFTKVFQVTKFSERLLNDPLTVKFRRFPDDTQRSFASSMIPFGRIFLEKGHKQAWILEGDVDILKISSNVKIGSLFYKILLRHEESGSPQAGKGGAQPSAFFPATKHTAEYDGRSGKYSRDSEKITRVTEEMREWRKTQEEMYTREREQKEAAYLKILSEEAAKRDAERENVMVKKLSELDKREKELSKTRKILEEKEDRLKQLELEVKDSERQLKVKQETLQQNTEHQQRRLEEDHKIEINRLNRQLRTYQEDLEKLKTKLVLSEKKLETKDAEIDSLMAQKREQPDSRLVQRVQLLEQENKTLKSQLREANMKKENYKKQSFAICQKLSRLQEERDLELKDQNENLRLQILASKEHKELKKERKAVQGLSETLKALQKETIVSKPSEGNGKGDRADFHTVPARKSITSSKPSTSTEEEIKRLTDERSKLLSSGAFTQFDMVIKELERKIVSLAKE